MPGALDASLARLGRRSVALYQQHFPSRRVSIPQPMELMADAVEAGKGQAGGDRTPGRAGGRALAGAGWGGVVARGGARL